MLKLGNSFGFLNFFIYLCIVKQEILTIKNYHYGIENTSFSS